MLLRMRNPHDLAVVRILTREGTVNDSPVENQESEEMLHTCYQVRCRIIMKERDRDRMASSLTEDEQGEVIDAGR